MQNHMDNYVGNDMEPGAIRNIIVKYDESREKANVKIPKQKVQHHLFLQV